MGPQQSWGEGQARDRTHCGHCAVPRAEPHEGGDATGFCGPHPQRHAVWSLLRAIPSVHSAARTRSQPHQGGDGLPDTLRGIRWGNVIAELPRESRQVPYTVSRQRPFARRRRRTLRPPAPRMRCKKPWVFLRRCALGWYVRLTTRVPFHHKDSVHYNTPHPGCWRRTRSAGPSQQPLWTTWGQPGLLSPEYSDHRGCLIGSGSPWPGRLLTVSRSPRTPSGVINSGLHTCGQMRIRAIPRRDRRKWPHAAHLCSAGTPRVVREPPGTPQELSTLMIIVCSLADRGEICSPWSDPSRSSRRDGQSRFPFHTTRQRRACAHNRLAALETSGVARR